MSKILTGSDYDRIEEAANDMIEDLGLTLFPVNCYEVAHLLGIELKKYSEIPMADRIAAQQKMECGYSARLGNKYYIMYNDGLDRNRVKFTIWHEIAHIQLGHVELDCQKSYDRQEEEANHFAAYVMAPLAFIHKLGLSSPIEIADVCETSLECACYAYEHYTRAFFYPSVRQIILSGRIARLLTYIPNKEVVA